MKLKDDKRCIIIKGKEGKDYRYINIPTFRIVWSLCNLSLGGKLRLRDDKNTEFV